jgi:hypothetical protein
MSMAIGLLFLVAFEGVRCGSRKYNKSKAKKHGYEGCFKSDSFGRPLDDSGRRLSRNEARALAEHRRSTAGEAEKARQWREKGNTLPDYGQASLKDRCSATSSSGSHDETVPQVEHNDQQNWQEWSISGAPRYTEHDEVHNSSQLVQRE